MNFLEIKNLTVELENQKILDNVSLTIAKSQLCLLLGPNGAGKSTLCKTILNDPNYEISSGEIFFKNQNILELETDERAKLGIFLQFQNPPEIEGVRFLHFLKSAFEQLNPDHEKFKSMKSFREFCEEKIKKYDLSTNFFRRNLNEGFSGGEKKLSEIIQMIILNPEFCILDEPDSGLDIDSRKKVIKAIKKMKKENETTFMVISHYTDFGMMLDPDTVHVLKDGKNYAKGGQDIVHKLESKGFDFES